MLRGIGIGIDRPLDLTKAASVPKLVAEISPFHDLLFVELDILPLGSDAKKAETDSVRAEFGDQIEGVRGITEAL